MLKEKFVEIYGDSSKEIRFFHSPGRINIIGEHTDYNGGYVFPCALNFGTFVAFRLRDDDKICFATANFDLRVETTLDDIKYEEKHHWANYPKGIVYYVKKLGHKLQGFEVLFQGNIPNGAGLSSSASIEIAMAVALNEVFKLNIDMIDLVKLSQKSENLFNGVNCGIMDQFAVGKGKKDYAILLNCETLEYSYVPLKLDGYKLLISNTNKKRGLADSKYNERRSECEMAVKDLNKELTIRNLSELSLEDFNKNINLIEKEIVKKRAKHVISENDRVIKSIEALKNNDIERLGKLMVESHNSLRDDYEVTGVELDTLVKEAMKLPYVIGSRMTGAGFGGCTISIVKEDMIEEFIKVVSENYEKKIGYKPTIYIGETGDGAKEV